MLFINELTKKSKRFTYSSSFPSATLVIFLISFGGKIELSVGSGDPIRYCGELGPAAPMCKTPRLGINCGTCWGIRLGEFTWLDT